MDSSAHQRKLDIVEELAQLADKAGLTLIELAIAFVINHPITRQPMLFSLIRTAEARDG